MNKAKTIVWSATPTPFLSDGSLDEKSVEGLVEQHVRLGVTGLFLAGTCGEGPYMPTAQRSELVRVAKRYAAGRLYITVQVSDTSAARVLENMKHAENAGADAVVIAAPWITTFAKRDFLRRYFLTPIEGAALPVGLYALGQPPGSALTTDLWREFALHPKVKFVKDSSASDEYMDTFLVVKAARGELRLLTGVEFGVVPAVAAGYDGCLLGTGILTARMIRRSLDALAAGDRKTADAWQEHANKFLHDLFGRDIGLWLGGLKYALKRRAIFTNEYMHLCYTLSPENKVVIDAALDRERDYI